MKTIAGKQVSDETAAAWLEGFNQVRRIVTECADAGLSMKQTLARVNSAQVANSPLVKAAERIAAEHQTR